MRDGTHPESQNARRQVIGAMTVGVGAALVEDLVVDKRFGFFVSHDLAQYKVPVHAGVPLRRPASLKKPIRLCRT
jgi:CO/xanthine dehydrogenase Mo-binding subunit